MKRNLGTKLKKGIEYVGIGLVSLLPLSCAELDSMAEHPFTQGLVYEAANREIAHEQEKGWKSKKVYGDEKNYRSCAILNFDNSKEEVRMVGWFSWVDYVTTKIKADKFPKNGYLIVLIENDKIIETRGITYKREDGYIKLVDSKEGVFVICPDN